MRRIFIMLGPQCNLQCKYCLQHDMVTVTNTEVSDEVINWIAEQANNQKNTINITFYGGEPLVHWSAIVSAVTKLDELKANVRYSVITNGKALDAEKVEYLNEHNFGVCVSWDGANVLETRGYDVIASNDCIVDINNLSVSAVLSSCTYPLDYLDSLETFLAKFQEKHNRNHGLNIDTILDFGNCGTLKEMDTDKIREQMTTIMQGEKEIYRLFAIKMCSNVQRIPSKRNSYANCGNGINVFNVDVDGNIYRCHNCGDKIGTIADNVADVIAKAKELDATTENYETCESCDVVKICRGGCPLVGDDGRSDYYCDIKRAFYEPVLAYATEHVSLPEPEMIVDEENNTITFR